MNPWISEEEKLAVYKTIFGRRDVRSFFKPDPVSSDTLARILSAAHHAGSVGYMQPWNFIVVESAEKRMRVKQSFLREREDAAKLFDGEKREKYLSYKLEGIIEAPVNLIVTTDSTRFGPQILGRNSMPDTDVYSTCCAIQNLWLAARAENIGVGWVSIIKPEEVRGIFSIPAHIKILAYLCLGYVTHFPEKPDLETLGWGKRVPLEQLVSYESWDGKAPKNREDMAFFLNQEY